MTVTIPVKKVNLLFTVTCVIILNFITTAHKVPAEEISVSRNPAGIYLSSPFGVAFGEGSKNLDHFMKHIRNLGVRRTKVCFYWHRIEPRPGKYNWNEVDAYISQLKHGDKALLNVFTTGWGTNQEAYKGATLKNDLCKKMYRNFIIKLVKRSNGKITYWQRDTEPASPRHYPADKYAEYTEAQRIFYEAVKSVQPNAIVVGVNCNGEFKYGKPVNAKFFIYILEHGKNYFDALDIRLYKNIYDIPQRVEWFRSRMKRYGYEKPIICTEFGGPDPRAISGGIFHKLKRTIGAECSNAQNVSMCIKNWVREHRDELSPKLEIFLPKANASEDDKRKRIHCHDIVQRHIIAYNSGVKATWWWNLQSAGKHFVFGKMRLMELPNTKFPGYYCFQRMVNKLSSISSIMKVPLSDDSIYYYKVSRLHKSVIYIAWHRDNGLDFYDAESSRSVPVRLPVKFNKVEITDVFGNKYKKHAENNVLDLSINDTPVFIEYAE